MSLSVLHEDSIISAFLLSLTCKTLLMTPLAEFDDPPQNSLVVSFPLVESHHL